MRRLFVAVAAVTAALVVLSTAGWWFLIREDAHLATSAPDIPDDLVQATAAPSEEATEAAQTTDALTFRINPELSEAAYFVDEELASVGLPSTPSHAPSPTTPRSSSLTNLPQIWILRPVA